MKNIYLLTLLIFLNPLQVLPQESYPLNGYVNDAETGEALIGATVYVNELNSGTVTNSYGFYSLTLVQGDYKIDFRYLG